MKLLLTAKSRRCAFDYWCGLHDCWYGLRTVIKTCQTPTFRQDWNSSSGQSAKLKIEEVDMQGKLEAAGLLPFFHVDLWPASAAVRELATHMKTRTGFIYADLRKCVVCCGMLCSCAGSLRATQVFAKLL